MCVLFVFLDGSFDELKWDRGRHLAQISVSDVGCASVFCFPSSQVAFRWSEDGRANE